MMFVNSQLTPAMENCMAKLNAKSIAINFCDDGLTLYLERLGVQIRTFIENAEIFIEAYFCFELACTISRVLLFQNNMDISVDFTHFSLTETGVIYSGEIPEIIEILK